MAVASLQVSQEQPATSKAQLRTPPTTVRSMRLDHFNFKTATDVPAAPDLPFMARSREGDLSASRSRYSLRFVRPHQPIPNKQQPAERSQKPAASSQQPEAGSKMAPKRPQDGPRWPQVAPGRPKMAPKWPQDGPKMAPRWPKMAPGGPRKGQDGPKMAPRGLH